MAFGAGSDECHCAVGIGYRVRIGAKMRHAGFSGRYRPHCARDAPVGRSLGIGREDVPSRNPVPVHEFGAEEHAPVGRHAGHAHFGEGGAAGSLVPGRRYQDRISAGIAGVERLRAFDHRRAEPAERQRNRTGAGRRTEQHQKSRGPDSHASILVAFVRVSADGLLSFIRPPGQTGNCQALRRSSAEDHQRRAVSEPDRQARRRPATTLKKPTLGRGRPPCRPCCQNRPLPDHRPGASDSIACRARSVWVAFQ